MAKRLLTKFGSVATSLALVGSMVISPVGATGMTTAELAGKTVSSNDASVSEEYESSLTVFWGYEISDLMVDKAKALAGEKVDISVLIDGQGKYVNTVSVSFYQTEEKTLPIKTMLKFDPADGRYHGDFVVDTTVRPGVYKFKELIASDSNGHIMYLVRKEDQKYIVQGNNPAFDAVSFIVDNTKYVPTAQDAVGPVVKSINAASTTIAAPGVIELTSDVVEDGSGVNFYNMTLNSLDYNNRKNISLGFSDYYMDYATNEKVKYPDGKMHAEYPISKYFPASTYKSVNSSSIADMAGNQGKIDTDVNITLDITGGDGSKNVCVSTFVDALAPNKYEEYFAKDLPAGNNYVVTALELTRGDGRVKKVLESVKGKNLNLVLENNNSELVINATNISEAKAIDVIPETYVLSTKNAFEAVGIRELVGDTRAYVCKFAGNDSLGLKATMRLYADYALRNYLGTSGINVYHYDANKKSLDLVAENISLQGDNRFEFDVENAGAYVLTKGQVSADIPSGPSTWKGKEGSEGFVYRLYNVALTRDAEAAGLADWNGQLVNKTKTAAEVAQGIFFSAEFQNKNYTDTQYVKFLYRTMFGREADNGGLNGWLTKLENGMSREYVFRGFAESQEFTNLCDSYSINRGEVTISQYRDQNEGVSGFMARLYTKMLGRSYEADGIEYWCKAYLTKEKTIEDIATDGFLHSQEFKNLGLSNEEYVTRMYQTFLGRQPDEAGYKDWVAQLNAGTKTRDDLVYGFTLSQEFANIKAQYGL